MNQVQARCGHVIKTLVGLSFGLISLLGCAQRANSDPVDQVDLQSAISCKTYTRTPDGDRFLFYKTRGGKLAQTLLFGANAGKSVVYDPLAKAGTYASGTVTVSIDKDFVIAFDTESFSGTCSPLARAARRP